VFVYIVWQGGLLEISTVGRQSRDIPQIARKSRRQRQRQRVSFSLRL